MSYRHDEPDPGWGFLAGDFTEELKQRIRPYTEKEGWISECYGALTYVAPAIPDYRWNLVQHILDRFPKNHRVFLSPSADGAIHLAWDVNGRRYNIEYSECPMRKSPEYYWTDYSSAYPKVRQVGILRLLDLVRDSFTVAPVAPVGGINALQESETKED